jgi:hypothetical protein
VKTKYVLVIAGGIAAGLVLGGAAVLLAAKAVRRYHTQSSSGSSEFPPAATHHERLPSDEEYRLLELVGRYGWPIGKGDVRFGTDDQGAYLFYKIGASEAHIMFTRDGRDFQIIGYDGSPVTGPLAERNPDYEAAVKELGQA